jgi:hypothetical protein
MAGTFVKLKTRSVTVAVYQDFVNFIVRRKTKNKFSARLP